VAAWAARPHRAGLNRPGPVRRSRLCRHTRLPLSCEGREEGRPGCGVGRWVGGRWGGELARRAGSPARWVGPVQTVFSPSVWPAAAVGVAVPPWRRAHSARRRPPRRGCGARGAILVQQAGSPSGGWWSRRRLSTGRSLPYWVEAEVACPGGGAAGAGMGRGSVSRSVRRHACRQSAGRARSPASPPRSARAGAAARALRAGGQVCLGLAAAGAVPHSHRGAPARPACRRGAAVGVAADMIPVHSDPPVFRRRAAMSQFPAAKDYPARATTPTPRRSGEATLGSFASLLRLVLVCTVTSTFSRA
jgi:hypothetical protein